MSDAVQGVIVYVAVVGAGMVWIAVRSPHWHDPDRPEGRVERAINRLLARRFGALLGVLLCIAIMLAGFVWFLGTLASDDVGIVVSEGVDGLLALKRTECFDALNQASEHRHGS